MLAYLRASDAHPTAASIHDDLRGGSPPLSLATVYRNLDVLVGEGLIDEVSVSGRAKRYDGNTDPHHHFVCDECGAIVDVALPEPRGLRRRLFESQALKARRISIDFYGLCPSCEEHAGDVMHGAEPVGSARRNH
jgi:Fe2+ or Zn2+ uptake regulation protein